jgi:hypothetical protein
MILTGLDGVRPSIPAPHRETGPWPTDLDVRIPLVLGCEHRIDAGKPELGLPLAVHILNVEIHEDPSHAPQAGTLHAREHLGLAVGIQIHDFGGVVERGVALLVEVLPLIALNWPLVASVTTLVVSQRLGGAAITVGAQARAEISNRAES